MIQKKQKKITHVRRSKISVPIVLVVAALSLLVAFYVSKINKLSHLRSDKVSVIVHSCNEYVLRGRYSKDDNTCKIYEDGQTILHTVAVPYPKFAQTNDRLFVYKFSDGSYELTKNTSKALLSALYYGSWLVLIVSFLIFQYKENRRISIRKKLFKHNQDVEKVKVTKVQSKLRKTLKSANYIKIHLYIFFILIFLPIAARYITVLSTASHSIARAHSRNPAEVKVTVSNCYDVKFLPDFCNVKLAYTGEFRDVTVANIDIYKRGQILQMYEFSDGELEETKNASWAKGTIAFTTVQLVAILGLCYLANKSETIKKRRILRMNRKKIKFTK